MCPSPRPTTTAERVQKVLARAGFGSRRACEALISAGRVTVGGRIAVLGDRVDPVTERLEVDGVPVVTRTDLVYYLLNKPARVVTTADDPQGRPTVVELVPAEPRVFPVGRLDYETEGLLLLTNDGELAQLLTHPRHGVEKTYVAEVDAVPGRGELRRLREGVDLDDGRTAPARARVLAQRADGAALELVVHEGRNRQVRRMCESVGLHVRRLVRTRIGPVRDDHLAPGAWRALRPGEVRRLYETATAEEPAGAGAPPPDGPGSHGSGH
ncbi:MAG TPA: pseudouridine synthase [Acidimicrobiia bacterium]|nr:pseudouridine synthase [Acidimicrobiia bacterium]